MFRPVLAVIFLAACSVGMRMRAPEVSTPAPIRDIPLLRVGVVEDHPWVIITENCGDKKMLTNTDDNTCVTGFLIDLLSKIGDELYFNTTLTQFNAKGVYDSSTKKFSELLGSVAANKTDVGLSPTAIIEDYKTSLDFTPPFYKSQNVSYALVLPKGSRLTSGFTDAIEKLLNQRHLEQLKETWFNEEVGSWTKAKQLSPQ